MKYFTSIAIIFFLLQFILLENGLGAAKEVKLLELARYERVTEVIKKYKQLCLEQVEKMNPDKIVSQNPDFFGGIKPGTEYWITVKSIFKEYMETSCSYLDKDRVLSEYVKVYSEKMSGESLDAILAFYQTEIGNKYLREMAVCTERMQTYYSEASQPAFEVAMKNYTNKIYKLVNKYLKNQ